jgi:hypothetical protein
LGRADDVIDRCAAPDITARVYWELNESRSNARDRELGEQTRVGLEERRVSRRSDRESGDTSMRSFLFLPAQRCGKPANCQERKYSDAG